MGKEIKKNRREFLKKLGMGSATVITGSMFTQTASANVFYETVEVTSALQPFTLTGQIPNQGECQCTCTCTCDCRCTCSCTCWCYYNVSENTGGIAVTSRNSDQKDGAKGPWKGPAFGPTIDPHNQQYIQYSSY